jgi:hypothetical protein
MPDRPREWVFLAYRLPREPSTPRIALWRRLRRLGAVQLLDGLVALPLDARNREQFEWLAEEVIEAAGNASTWIARPTTLSEHKALQRRMTEAVAEEYRELIARAQAAADEDAATRHRTVTKLRRELQRIRRRDYFPPPEREQAERVVNALVTMVEELAS